MTHASSRYGSLFKKTFSSNVRIEEKIKNGNKDSNNIMFLYWEYIEDMKSQHESGRERNAKPLSSTLMMNPPWNPDRRKIQKNRKKRRLERRNWWDNVFNHEKERTNYIKGENKYQQRGSIGGFIPCCFERWILSQMIIPRLHLYTQLQVEPRTVWCWQFINIKWKKKQILVHRITNHLRQLNNILEAEKSLGENRKTIISLWVPRYPTTSGSRITNYINITLRSSFKPDHHHAHIFFDYNPILVQINLA